MHHKINKNEFLRKDYSKPLNGNDQNFTPLSLKELEKDMVDSTSDVNDPEPMIYVGGKIFVCEGEIGIVGGKEKAGKSNILISFAAYALDNDSIYNGDTNFIRCKCAAGKWVIYIDTELGKPKTKKFYKSVQKFLGTTNLIPNLRCFSLAEYPTAKERLYRLRSLLYHYSDTHFWIIDHAADFLESANNEEAATAQLSWFNAQAKKLRTVFLIVMHENPGQSDKLRGHLGSQAQRICGGTLTVKKNKKDRVHSIECKALRNDEDFDPIILEWNKKFDRLAPVENDRAKEILARNDPRVKLIKMAKRCTLGYEHISYKELVTRIHNNFLDVEGKQRTVSTAKTRVNEMLKEKIVQKDSDGKYFMVHGDKASE